MEDNDDDSKMADLLSCFQQQLTFQESVLKLCQPELESNQTHISGMNSRWLKVREAHFHLALSFPNLQGQMTCQIIVLVPSMLGELVIITVCIY